MWGESIEIQTSFSATKRRNLQFYKQEEKLLAIAKYCRIYTTAGQHPKQDILQPGTGSVL